MCFSAEADFVSGALISGVGVATLAKVERPSELALGAIPLVLGLHQLVEGFVWLGVDGSLSRQSTDRAINLYVAIAWILVPVLVPLAVMLVTPPSRRRRAMAACVALGSAVAAYLATAVLAGDVTAHVVHHTIQYGGAPRYAAVATFLYVIATCAPPLLSRQPAIVWFGAANLVAVAIIALVQVNGLTSVWCVWAAIVSVLIYVQFVAWRRGDARAVPTAVVTPSAGPPR
jgi:hypothetical protein